MKKIKNYLCIILSWLFFLFLFASLLFLLCGCSTGEQLAKGISEKTISGSGAVVYSRAGLDTQTQTPELATVFVWGDYTSGHAGSEVFRMEESEDASIFNADAITKKKKIFFMTGDKKRMDAVVEKLSK